MMKTRILAAVVILPVALAILLIFPPIVLAVTLAVLSVIAAYELFAAVNKTCKKTPSPRAAVYAMSTAAMIPFVVYFNNIIGFEKVMYTGELAVFFILLCLIITDFLLTYKSEKRVRLRQLLITPVAAMIIPYMLSSLIGLRMQGAEIGRYLVMLPLITAVLTDSGAYFTGIAAGKHKPFPNISPNKTTEGFIGGILIGTAGLVLYGVIINNAASFDINLMRLFIYGITGAIVTEAGDLLFSFIKRKCGIKDYGKLIPGHGGILDRLDSLICLSPVMYALVILFPVV